MIVTKITGTTKASKTDVSDLHYDCDKVTDNFGKLRNMMKSEIA